MAARRRFQLSRRGVCAKSDGRMGARAQTEFSFRASHLRHGSAPAGTQLAWVPSSGQRRRRRMPAAARQTARQRRGNPGISLEQCKQNSSQRKKTPALFHKSNIKCISRVECSIIAVRFRPVIFHSLHDATPVRVTGRVILIVGRFYNTCSNADRSHSQLQIISFK